MPVTPLDTATHGRYRIRQNPASGFLRPFEIIDDLMGGQACALPDASGYLKVLAFRNAKEARDWLVQCQQKRGRNAAERTL